MSETATSLIHAGQLLGQLSCSGQFNLGQRTSAGVKQRGILYACFCRHEAYSCSPCKSLQPCNARKHCLFPKLRPLQSGLLATSLPGRCFKQRGKKKMKETLEAGLLQKYGRAAGASFVARVTDSPVLGFLHPFKTTNSKVQSVALFDTEAQTCETGPGQPLELNHGLIV